MSQLIESTFKTFDGAELFYRAWRPSKETQEAVIILHRGHEHSGRVAHLVEELELHDKWVFAFDLRGHGLSPGSRGWAKSFDVWVKDLNSFSIFMRTQFGLEMRDTVVVANSVGSVMAVQWVHDYAPGIRGLVLAAPAFKIKLYVPFALSFLRLATYFTDKLFVNSYVRSHMLTRDPLQAKGYDSDQLITKRIAVSILVSLFDSTKRLFADAQAIEVPLLVLSAGSDFVVNNKVQKEFFDRVSSPIKKFVELPQFRHALFHEKDRFQVTEPTKEFLRYCFVKKKASLPAILPPPREFSVQSLKKLSSRPPVLQLFFYTLLRKALEVFGPVSEGMRIGLKHGFDSGLSLDYIYQNKPRGRFLIGKVVDFFYVNAIGWRGIRKRKKHLIETLSTVVQDLHSRGEKPVILDCASGCGRYLFETVAHVKFPVDLHLRDLNNENLNKAEEIANAMNIENVTFENADAFAEKSYINTPYRPNIVIVSGLFELFSDNQLLAGTLSGIRNVMQPGGYIIYTGQPWHPQLEMIGRVLNNHRGHRWIMRPRVQAELDEVVSYMGFRKLDTVIDQHGIFTVSVAQEAPRDLDI